MNRLRLAMMLGLAMTVLCASALRATSGQTKDDDKYWALTQKYCNARFGFCVYYPASVGWRDEKGVWHSGDPKAGPENNDGSKFDNGNGLEMTVSGINNATNGTLRSEMSEARKRFDKVTYKAQGKNWFILKGQKADAVIFLKTYVGRGSVNHLEILVPAVQKDSYSQIVSNIAGSFTPGKLSAAH